MKKLLFIFICITLVFCVLCVNVFAETPGDTIDNEDVSKTDVITEEAPNEAIEQTVFTRIWEFVEGNIEIILTFVADGMVLVVAFFLTKGGKKLSAKLLGYISKNASEDTQEKLVNGFNELLEENATLQKEVEALRASVENANKKLVIVQKEAKAVLESMFNVWGNSKNLSQGLKDVVAARYADCVKAEAGQNEKEHNN